MNRIFPGMMVFNLKTKCRYKVISLAINTTNKDDGQQMVVYTKEDDPSLTFVREFEEFKLKFVGIDDMI